MLFTWTVVFSNPAALNAQVRRVLVGNLTRGSGRSAPVQQPALRTSTAPRESAAGWQLLLSKPIFLGLLCFLFGDFLL